MSGLAYAYDEQKRIIVLFVKDDLVDDSSYEIPKGGRELTRKRKSIGRFDKSIVDTMMCEHHEEAGGALYPRFEEDDDIC